MTSAAGVQPTKKPNRWWVWILVIAVGVFFLAALGILVAVLFPTLIITTDSGRTWPTRNIIMQLATGIEAFRDDFGVYPPSRWTNDHRERGGSGLLAYYLMGPEGKGWGKAAGGAVPFGPPNLVVFYGPYFCAEDHQGMPPLYIGDSFRPFKPILYFRAEPGREPLFDVRDNPVDPTCAKGFASQEHFELSLKIMGEDGKRRWRREDYLLISPGTDRLYGYVVEDEAAGKYRPAAQQDVDAEKAFFDDITNFR